MTNRRSILAVPVPVVSNTRVFPSRNGAFLQSRRLPVRATARRQVRLRIPLCGVGEYASAESLVFLDMAEKSLVCPRELHCSHPRTRMGTRLPSAGTDAGHQTSAWGLSTCYSAVTPTLREAPQPVVLQFFTSCIIFSHDTVLTRRTSRGIIAVMSITGRDISNPGRRTSPTQ